MARESAQLQAALFNQLVEPKLSHGDRKMLKIVDAAIECYAKNGVEGVTMDQIARQCGVSRPLLSHYFKNKRELFFLAVKRIRLNFQDMAVKAIQAQRTPSGQLRAYVDSTFDWIERYPSHIRTWLLYLYGCSSDHDGRALNTELVNTGHDRIIALLREGARLEEFASGAFEWRAKLIQVVISGALVSVATEDLRIPLNEIRKHTVQACFDIARSRKRN